MAKIIEHGKYWVKEAQKAYGEVQVKCPECGYLINMNSYYVYITPAEVWCSCGGRFIPETTDIVKEQV